MSSKREGWRKPPPPPYSVNQKQRTMQMNTDNNMSASNPSLVLFLTTVTFLPAIFWVVSLWDRDSRAENASAENAHQLPVRKCTCSFIFGALLVDGECGISVTCGLFGSTALILPRVEQSLSKVLNRPSDIFPTFAVAERKVLAL